MTHPRSTVVRFILDNSLLLLAGTAAAVAWANLDLAGYDVIAHPLHFCVNDVGMVFFFALAAKEIFEATLPGGSFASFRSAISPLAAAIGGMALPAVIYVPLAWMSRILRVRARDHASTNVRTLGLKPSGARNRNRIRRSPNYGSQLR